ncbi:hypothetical protein DSQ19_03015 [Candidatus Nitrosotenuis sp. DW1]|nr:hypothetical protein DSQ19_03015 [Candidatus Nitrosotenuis sp. DW1]
MSYGDEYKSHAESKPAYGGRQKNSQDTGYLREQQPVSERKSIEQEPAPELVKSETKTEIQNNDEPSSPRQLPIVELGEKKFFLDERLQELRDVEDFSNSISLRDLDLVPEKTEQVGQYETEKQADVKDAFDLPKYEDRTEFGQTDAARQKRPSPYWDRLE